MDSLCIIQSNIEEIQKEIPNMKEIYSKAVNTIALINHSLTVEEIKIIEKLCEDYGKNRFNIQSQMVILKKIIEYLKKGNIFDSEWFKRVWIIQECIISNNIVIFNNDCVGLLIEIICFIFQNALENDVLRNIVISVPKIVGELFNNHIISKIHKKNMTIKTLLSLIQKRDCTRQEDKIYGIMGLINISLKVEYGIEVKILFLKLIESVTKNGDHSWLLLYGNNNSIIPNLEEENYNIDPVTYIGNGYSSSLKVCLINTQLIIKMQICLIAEIEFIFVLAGDAFHQLQEVIDLLSNVFIDWLNELIKLICPYKKNIKYNNKTYSEAVNILLSVKENKLHAIKKSISNIILKEIFSEMVLFTKPLVLSKIKVYNTEKTYYILIHGNATIGQKIFMTDYYYNECVLYFVGNIYDKKICKTGSFIYEQISNNIKSQIVQII